MMANGSQRAVMERAGWRVSRAEGLSRSVSGDGCGEQFRAGLWCGQEVDRAVSQVSRQAAGAWRVVEREKVRVRGLRKAAPTARRYLPPRSYL